MGELGADRLAGSGAEAAERARVHPAARLEGIDEAPGIGDEVPAVADHDRVAVEHLAQLVVDTDRVKRRAGVLELRPLGLALLRLDLAQLLAPGSRPPGVGAGRLPDRREAGRDVADQVEVGEPIRGQLVGRGVEADDPRLLAEALAEPEAEIERDPDDEGDVGLLEAGAAGAAEAELVVGGEAAPSEAVEEDGDPERLGQGAQRLLSPAPVEAATAPSRPGARPPRAAPLPPPPPRAGPACPDTAGGTSASASLKTTSSG